MDGIPVVKASHLVDAASTVTVSDAASTHYVSRAAFKLKGALDACMPLGLTVAGRRALDAGASTGGFTQVLLEHGVSHVVAVDVGHHQMAPSVRDDPRVTAIEGVNVRDLSATSEGSGVDLVVADLSFISLTLVLEPLVAFAAPRADYVLMVKPQFEVGRGGLDGGGVVRTARARAQAVHGVARAMTGIGMVIHSIERSALPGPAGNQEYFIWGSTSWQADPTGPRPVLDNAQMERAVAQAVKGE